MAVPEPFDSVQQLGVSDILTNLCPGAVFLTSGLLWAPLLTESQLTMLTRMLGSTTGPFVLLLLAYTFGIVLNGWSSRGYVRFRRLRGGGFRSTIGLRRVLWMVKLILPTALHGRRGLQVRESDADTRLELVELIRSRYGDGVVVLLDPHNVLHVFRCLLPASVRATEQSTLAEASAAFRRRCFAEGVALACVLVAIEALTANGLMAVSGVPARGYWLLALVCAVNSVVLRGVSQKLHTDEQIYTYPLVRSWSIANQSPHLEHETG